jgi:hypothetical protein
MSLVILELGTIFDDFGVDDAPRSEMPMLEAELDDD